MRRWLMRLGATFGVAVLGSAALLVWPLVWPADPDASVRTVEGRQVGEAAGYVVSLDPDAGVLKISSSILGLWPVTLAIDAETPITVGDKQGGLGDLAVDTPVRVAYEIEGQTRRARSVELVLRDSETHDTTPSVVPSAPATVSSPPIPSLDAPARIEPLRPAPAAAAVNVTPKRPPVAAVPAVDVAPRRPPLAPAAATSTPPRKVVERPQAATTPAPVLAPVEDEKALEAAARRAARPSTSARPADDGGPADGSGAIDWLLRSRER